MYVRDKFLKKFILSIRQHPCLLSGGKVLLMVSGGVDSMVLLTAVGMLKDAPIFKDITFGVITINHGIRPEAVKEVEYVCQMAKGYGFKCHRVEFSPERRDEATLRHMRMDVVDDVMEKFGYNRVWTAHHASDVIETVLVQMLRGSDIRGVVSLRWCSDKVGHPMLGFWKEEIEQFAKRHGVRYFVDKTNYDMSIARNFVRHRVIPILENVLNGREGIYAFWKKSCDVITALDYLLGEVWERHVRITKKGDIEFVNCSVEVCVELLKRWMRKQGVMLPGWLIEKIRLGKGRCDWGEYSFRWVDGKLLVEVKQSGHEGFDRPRDSTE